MAGNLRKFLLRFPNSRSRRCYSRGICLVLDWKAPQSLCIEEGWNSHCSRVWYAKFSKDIVDLIVVYGFLSSLGCQIRRFILFLLKKNITIICIDRFDKSMYPKIFKLYVLYTFIENFG